MMFLQLDPSLVLKDSDALLTSISESFDQIAVELLREQGIFTALVSSSLLIALCSFMFFLIQWIQRFISRPEALSQLIWPLVCLILLSGDGKLLADIELGARQIEVSIVKDVLEQAIDGVTLQNQLRQALADGTAKELVAAVNRICAAEVESRQQRCREEQIDQVIQKLEQQAEADESWLPSMSGILTSLKNSFIGQFALTAEMGLVAVISYTFSAVVVWGIEIALIILLVTSPLALALSLLPLPGRPLFAWISGFLGIAIAKIGLVTSTALAASVVVSSEANLNTLLFPLYIAIGSPVIAGALARIATGSIFASMVGAPAVLGQALRVIRLGR